MHDLGRQAGDRGEQGRRPAQFLHQVRADLHRQLARRGARGNHAHILPIKGEGRPAGPSAPLRERQASVLQDELQYNRIL